MSWLHRGFFSLIWSTYAASLGQWGCSPDDAMMMSVLSILCLPLRPLEFQCFLHPPRGRTCNMEEVYLPHKYIGIKTKHITLSHIPQIRTKHLASCQSKAGWETSLIMWPLSNKNYKNRSTNFDVQLSLSRVST